MLFAKGKESLKTHLEAFHSTLKGLMATFKPRLLFLVLAIAIDISNILLNILLTYTLKKLGKLRIVSYWLIFWLSVSDLLVGMTGLVCRIATLVISAPEISPIIYLTIYIFVHLSGFLTMVIAVDRCIHMKLLNKYTIFMTRRKSNVALVCTAVLSLCLTGLHDLFPLASMSFSIIGVPAFFIVYILTYFSVRKGAFKDRTDSVSRKRRAEVAPSILACIKDSTGNIEHEVDQKQAGESNVISVNNTRIGQDCKDTLQQLDIAPATNSSGHDVSIVKSQDFRKIASFEQNKPIRRQQRPEKEFGKALFCILASFSICYIPINVVNFVGVLSKEGSLSQSIMQYIGLLPLCNSFFNAIIVISFSREIRTFVKALASRCISSAVTGVFCSVCSLSKA